MSVTKLFATPIYRNKLFTKSFRKIKSQIMIEIEDLMSLDIAGIAWSDKNYKNGFTSYASANELQKHSPTFYQLEQEINKHVKTFAKQLDFDLGRIPLKMTTCWVNVMPENTHHGIHIHPLSIISGTFYVDLPKSASPIRFEDPRLTNFMAAPPKLLSPKNSDPLVVDFFAEAGDLILFESWLRHEVPINRSKKPRISISFNYGWE